MKTLAKVLIFVSLLMISIVFIGYVKKTSIPSIFYKTNVLPTVYAVMGTNEFLITPLKGGLSESTLYKVDSEDKSCVIRFIGHRSRKDKLREIDAQTIASQEGWGPTLYASDINEGWIIMEYIKQIPLTAADRMNDEMYIALGKCLQHIHTGPKFLTGKPILKEIEELLEKLQREDKIPQSIDYVILENLLESIKKNYPLILTPTHRDLNPNNIIFSDKCHK